MANENLNYFPYESNPEPTETDASSAPEDFGYLTIDPVILTNNQIDQFRLFYQDGNPSEALAKDLVETIKYQDFSDENRWDPNFITYEGLRDGTAPVLDYLREGAGRDAIDRRMTNEQIILRFSNAEPAQLARGVFGEFMKVAPAVAAGAKSMKKVAGPAFSLAGAASTAYPPAAPVAYTAAGLASLGSFIVPTFGLYQLSDEIEERLIGPDPVVTPSQRALYEAYRTFGGGLGGQTPTRLAISSLFPTLSRKGVNKATEAALVNIAKDSPAPIAARISRALEKSIASSVELAKKYPGLVSAVETGATGLASTGAFISESQAPGSTGLRLLYEFGLGNLGYAGIAKALPKVRSAIATQAAEGVGSLSNLDSNIKKEKVFTRINELFDLYGDEKQLDDLLNNLTSPELRKELEDAFPGINFTSAQLSDDPILQLAEASLARKDEFLDAARYRSQKEGYAVMTGLIKALRDQGSRPAIKLAAEMQTDLYEGAMKNALQSRVNSVLKAAEKVKGPNAQLSETQLNEIFSKTISDFVSSLNAKQRDLWSAVDPEIKIFTAGQFDDVDPSELPEFLKSWQRNKYRMKSSQSNYESKVSELKGLIRESRANLGLIKNEDGDVVDINGNVVEDVSSLPGITNGDLQEIRSRALSLSRQLSREPETEAYSYRTGDLAEAILKDLDDYLGGDDLYNQARAFTKSKKDLIDRTFAGELERVNQFGQYRIPDEIALERLLSGKDSASTLRYKQVKAVADFLDSQGLSKSINNPYDDTVFSDVDDVVETFLRSVDIDATKEIFNPKTNTIERVIDEAKLSRWKDQHKSLLQYFPQLQVDLNDAISAQRALDVWKSTQKNAFAKRAKVNILGKLFNGADPSYLLGKALDDGDVKGLRRLFSLHHVNQSLKTPSRLSEGLKEKGGLDYVRGAWKDVTLNKLLDRAGGEGAFSPQKFYMDLFGPVKKDSNVSLSDILLREGIVGEKDLDRIKFMANQLRKVQAADVTKGLSDPETQQASLGFLELYAATAGSALGSKMYKMFTGGESGPGVLVVSGAFAREFRNLLTKLPASANRKLLAEIFTDPDLTAMLITKPGANASDKAKRGYYDKLTGWLKNKFFDTAVSGTPFMMREAYEQEDRANPPYPGFPGFPEDQQKLIDDLMNRLKEDAVERIERKRRREGQDERVTPIPREEFDQIEEQETLVPEGFSASLDRTPALPTRSAAAPRPSPTVVAQAPVAARPADRSRFAAMFPSDITSPLIKSQGIESLLG